MALTLGFWLGAGQASAATGTSSAALSFQVEAQVIVADYRLPLDLVVSGLGLEGPPKLPISEADKLSLAEAMHAALEGPLALLVDGEPLAPDIERLEVVESADAPAMVVISVERPRPATAETLRFRWDWSVPSAPLTAEIRWQDGRAKLSLGPGQPSLDWPLPNAHSKRASWFLLGVAGAALLAAAAGWYQKRGREG